MAFSKRNEELEQLLKCIQEEKGPLQRALAGFSRVARSTGKFAITLLSPKLR